MQFCFFFFYHFNFVFVWLKSEKRGYFIVKHFKLMMLMSKIQNSSSKTLAAVLVDVCQCKSFAQTTDYSTSFYRIHISLFSFFRLMLKRLSNRPMYNILWRKKLLVFRYAVQTEFLFFIKYYTVQ